MHLGGNVTVASYMSYLMKGWSERSIFIVGKSGVSSSFKILEPGNQPLSKLLLCSSNFSNVQCLSCLVCGSYHFVLALLLE